MANTCQFENMLYETKKYTVDEVFYSKCLPVFAHGIGSVASCQATSTEFRAPRSSCMSWRLRSINQNNALKTFSSIYKSSHTPSSPCPCTFSDNLTFQSCPLVQAMHLCMLVRIYARISSYIYLTYLYNENINMNI